MKYDKIVVPEKGSAQARKLLYRANYWREPFKKRTKDLDVLSQNEKNEIISLFSGYQDLIDVDTVFHSFYKEKTGEYDKRIFPIDLYYCFVDPYYNDWEIAPVMDNKCLYHRLFKDSKQPVIFFCRVNNIWTDINARLLSKTEINGIIDSSGELVIKQAKLSEGGKIFSLSVESKKEKIFGMLVKK